MKFLKNISIVLLSIICIKNSFSSFTVENDTGISPYGLRTQNSNFLEDFRIRVTFHKSPKDLEWLNNNFLEVNKASLPDLNGFVSEPVKITFPDLYSDHTKFITLYLTATCHHNNKKYFMIGETFELDKSRKINNLHIFFQGINNAQNSINADLKVNSSLVNIVNKKTMSYVTFG